MQRLLLTLTALTMVACAPSPTKLPDDQRALLSQPPAGSLVYRGHVSWEGEDVESLSYERWVARSSSGLVSTHVTLDPEPIILQTVTHTQDHVVASMLEIDAQLGVVSTARVEPDGSIDFTRTQGGDSMRRREEPGGGPVVSGPTLFGFTSHRWDDLAAGEVVAMRFVVCDHGRSYGFELEMTRRDEERAIVVMRPTGWLERWVVAPMTMTFDARARTILRYEGSIPPRDRTLRVRRASVRYVHAGAM